MYESCQKLGDGDFFVARFAIFLSFHVLLHLLLFVGPSSAHLNVEGVLPFDADDQFVGTGQHRFD